MLLPCLALIGIVLATETMSSAGQSSIASKKGHDLLAAQVERVAAVAMRAASDAGEARADLQLVSYRAAAGPELWRRCQVQW